MNNFELIDDYLSNRLKGEEKEAFDKQLSNDPSLKSDLDFQKQVVEGIRNARAAELKQMLSKVPVGGTVITANFSVMKMAAGLIAAGVVGAALYFYMSKGEMPPFNKAATDFNAPTEQTKPTEQVPVPADKTEVEPQPESTSPSAPVESNKEIKKSEKKSEQVAPVTKPQLEVTDPSEDLQNDNATENKSSANARPEITPSSIQVDIDSSNKKYDFHYQFVSNKLMLYGSFDKSLYEVLEINGDNHAVFLFYKEAYYLLDEGQSKITKLEPIKDAALVSKLKEYRKR